jgi:hypothetical protein
MPEKVINVCFGPVDLIPLNPKEIITNLESTIEGLSGKKVLLKWKQPNQKESSYSDKFIRLPIKGSKDIALTVLLPQLVGFTPPSNEPIPIGKWTQVPNSPILKNLNLSFSKEALEAIRKTDNKDVPYEIDLMEMRLVEKPWRGSLKGMDTTVHDE